MSSRRMPAEGRTAVPVTYQPWLVLLSFVMAIQGAYVGLSLAVQIGDASGLALWLATGGDSRPPLILSAIAFGLAVSGMHYTAMQGVTLFPHATASVQAPALSSDLLAIVVAIVAFCVSAIFLLTLVPDRTRPASGALGADFEPALARPAGPLADFAAQSVPAG